jgi:hypothetical protein
MIFVVGGLQPKVVLALNGLGVIGITRAVIEMAMRVHDGPIAVDQDDPAGRRRDVQTLSSPPFRSSRHWWLVDGSGENERRARFY